MHITGTAKFKISFICSQ